MPEAFLVFSTALLDFAKELIKSQPPDVQKQIWEWYVADMTRWRKIFHLD